MGGEFMERENDETKIVLREAVHLSAEEISDYLDGWLSPDSAKSVEQHLEACNYCSEEVALVKWALEKEPAAGILGAIAAVRENVVDFFSKKKRQFKTLWLGQSQYDLRHMTEYPDFWEVTALTTKQLVLARCADVEQPGSFPLAVEASGGPPLMAGLAQFEPFGPYNKIERHFSEPDDRNFAGEPDTFACGSLAPAAAFGYVAAVPGHRDKSVPRSELILKCQAKRDTIEIFWAVDQDKLLLRISPVRPSGAR
jgi:hypothetical protein